MKKIVSQLAILVFVLAVFSSCGKSNSEQVKETGEKFLSALTSGDLATARQLVTPATFEKWGDATQVIDDILTPEQKVAAQSLGIQVESIKVNGDEAEALTTITIPYFRKDITVLHFKKIDGKWLVNEPGIIVKEVIRENLEIINADAVPNDSATTGASKK